MSNETVNKVFLEIIPSYLVFYNRKQYDTGFKINLYDCFELVLTWKKCKNYFIHTTIKLLNNYTPTSEDAYILQEVSNMVKGNTITRLVKWYRDQCKQNNVECKMK
jgi:hypothetical protein